VDDWLTQPRQTATNRDEFPQAPKAPNRLVCRQKAHAPGHTRLLAMQKVEGSSPFSRLEVPAIDNFLIFLIERGTDG
jgi:hypothetical protein